MPRFPADAPRDKVLKALAILGFRLIREGNHLALERTNEDGSKTPLTLPNHRTLTGGDYLYPAEHFVLLDLPAAAQDALRHTA